MKQGRPTNPNSKKGRTHAALITLKAEILLREVKRKRKQFNFSRYVTEHLIRDFGNSNIDLNLLKLELRELNKEVDKYNQKKDEKRKEIMDKLRITKMKEDDKMFKEFEEELRESIGK